MSVLIKVAKSTAELLQIFEFRYRVLKLQSEFQINLHSGVDKISDYLDSLPDTIHLSAYEKGKLIGYLRATTYNPYLPSHNQKFSFVESYKDLNQAPYFIDFSIIDPNNNSHQIIFSQMISLLFNQLSIKSVSKLYYVAKKNQIHFLKGFSFFDLELDKSKVERPLIFDVSENFSEIKNKISTMDLFRFDELFPRIIYYPGEFLIMEGEKGNSAFLIESGEVEILSKNGNSVISLGKVNEGNIVGEIAMLTGDERMASIVAIKPTVTLCLDRNEFMENVYNDPSRAIEVFKLFSTRLNKSNVEMKKLREEKGL